MSDLSQWEAMRDEVVTEFDDILPPRMKGTLTRRDCFSLAILTIIDAYRCDPSCNVRLVHGVVRDSFNPGRYVQHAWCELAGEAEWSDGRITDCVVVVDYSQPDPNARFRPREEMYAAMGLMGLRYYSIDQALREGLAEGHDGPWASSPPRM